MLFLTTNSTGGLDAAALKSHIDLATKYSTVWIPSQRHSRGAYSSPEVAIKKQAASEIESAAWCFGCILLQILKQRVSNFGDINLPIDMDWKHGSFEDRSVNYQLIHADPSLTDNKSPEIEELVATETLIRQEPSKRLVPTYSLVANRPKEPWLTRNGKIRNTLRSHRDDGQQGCSKVSHRGLSLGLVSTSFAMTIAAIFVIFDTIIWLSICFTLAGPMLFSAICEALLDNRIIGFLSEQQRNFRLILDRRCNTDLPPYFHDNAFGSMVGVVDTLPNAYTAFYEVSYQFFAAPLFMLSLNGANPFLGLIFSMDDCVDCPCFADNTWAWSILLGSCSPTYRLVCNLDVNCGNCDCLVPMVSMELLRFPTYPWSGEY